MNLTVLDLFCGAGGLSLGFKWAEFKSVLAVDNYKPALDTYNANLGGHARCIDLSDPEVELPSTTVLVGGPPCQGFSSAGARRNGDSRNSLVASYAKIVVRLRPRAFVFENVEGFLTAEDGARVFDLLTPILDAGYRVHLQKVNAANYGVPQHRKRVVAIGALGFDPTFPAPTHTAFGAPGAMLFSRNLPLTPTVLEAIGDLPLPANTPPGIPQGHFCQPLEGLDLERALALRPGMTMRDLPDSLHHDSFRRRAFRRVKDGTPTEKRGGAPAGVRRLKPDEPSKAITGCARSEFFHPIQNRPLTIRECARLQTLPDGFEFSGNLAEQGQLIGNAVPPLFGFAVASTLAEDLHRHPGLTGDSHGALLSFEPTHSEGCSPILRKVTDHVLLRYKKFRLEPTLTLWSDDMPTEGKASMTLSKTQRAALTKIRTAGNSQLDEGLDNAVCSYLLAIAVKDLEVSAQFPEISGTPDTFFTKGSVSTLRLEGIDFLPLYERFLGVHKDAEAYFICLAKLHKSRLKYERILRFQPLPTFEQVGPRGLLQYGSLTPEALAGLLYWRKWLFDLDNRAGQETGYLFEPIIAHAIGGVPFGAKKSPIRRIGRDGGRQVDAICGESRRAYEFKVRVTIASSGQGRWAEELSFPREAKQSGFTPVLVVLDPTENDKLEELSKVFIGSGGLVFTGDDAWKHLKDQAGEIMSKFIHSYVEEPLERLLKEAPEKLPSFLMTLDHESNNIRITVGQEVLKIERHPAQELSGGKDEIPEDVDEEL